MSVVASLELHHVVSFGVRPGEPHGAHGRLGSRAGHADFPDRRKVFRHKFREPGFRLAGSAEARSHGKRLSHRRDHRRVRVAEDQGTPRSHIVDEPVSVGVVDVCSPGPGYEKRGSPHGGKRPHGAVYSSHQDIFRPREKLLRIGGVHRGSVRAERGRSSHSAAFGAFMFFRYFPASAASGDRGWDSISDSKKSAASLGFSISRSAIPCLSWEVVTRGLSG